MLSYIPDLIHLYLEDALAGAPSFLSSSAFNISQKIYLPHLSRLWTVAPLSTVTIPLLSCVNIPLSTQVRLEKNAIPNVIPLLMTMPRSARSLHKDSACSKIRNYSSRQAFHWSLNSVQR
jgi:hypothetical protein